MRWVSVIGAWLILGTVLGAAEPDGPKVSHTAIGFNAQFRNRAWSPLTVRIENPGPARAFTILAETQGGFSGQRVTFERVVWAPSNSRRQVDLLVFPDLPPAVGDDKPSVATVFNVRLTDGAAHVWSELTVIGNTLPEEIFAVLVADQRFISYSFLRGVTLGPARRPVGRFVTQPAKLPERPLVYAAVDALILGELGAQPLSPLQHRALRDWVRGGGHLIVAPGTTFPDAHLADLLPARYLGARVVETLPALAPGHHFPSGVAFARLLPHDGDITHGDRDRPLVVTRREGLGRVTALAFDAGAEDVQAWAGAPAFWAELLAAPSLLANAERVLERSPAIEGILSSLAGIKVLARPALLLYLAGSISVLLLILLAFRFTRAPEWGWVVAVVLAIGGSIAAVAAATSWKSQPSPFLTELFVATARSGAEVVTAQAAVGLFSPTEQTYQLTTAQDTLALRAGPSQLAPPERFVTAYEAQLSLPDLRVRADDVRLMYARGVSGGVPPAAATLADPAAVASPVPTPRAQLVVGATGFALTLENRTAQPLEDGFFKYHRFVLPVGDLAPGERFERANIRAASGAFSSRVVRGGNDELRARLREIFFPAPVFGLARTFAFEERRFYNLFRGSEPQPVFFAWSHRNPVTLAQTHPPVARRAQGLWAVETELAFDGPVLLAPKGTLPLRVRSRAAATSDAGEGRFFGTRPTQLLVEFALPAGWPDLELEQARLFLEFRGSAFRAIVRLAPRDEVGADEPNLDRFVTLTGDAPWSIAEPARFFNPATRSLLVAVEIEAAQAEGLTGETAILGLSAWQVRELDVEVKGIVR